MSFVLLGILNAQAEAGPAPTPFPLPGVDPDLWLDASDASTITASGGSVSQWNNKGTLSDFAQATSALQPTTGVTTINGLNVIDFDSTGLVSQGLKSQWNFMHDGSDYFLAFVAKIEAPTASLASLFATRDYIGADRGISYFIFQSSSTFRYAVTNGSNEAVQLDFGVSYQDQILSAVFDPDNGTAADRIDYYVNNTQGLATNTKTGSTSASDPATNLQLGLRASGSDLPFIGSFAEIIVVSGADATETNRQTVVDYLNDKWGIF